LRGTFEVNNGLLKQILLGIVHAQAGDDVYFGGVVAVAFLVVVDGLELVLLLLVEVAHLGEDFRVGGDFGDKDIVPLQSLSPHSNQLIHMCDLIDHLIRVGNNRVQLFKRLQRLIIIAETLIYETQIVDGFDAVSLNTNSLKEELLGAVVVLVHKKAVALVHEGFGVVAVVLDRQVGELFRIFEIVLKEVQERDVV